MKGEWHAPTTIIVNWMPFLTLLALRLPANDIFAWLWTGSRLVKVSRWLRSWAGATDDRAGNSRGTLNSAPRIRTRRRPSHSASNALRCACVFLRMQSLTRTSCYVLPLKPLCSRASLARYFAAGSAPRNSSDPQIPQDAHPNGSEESERVAPVKIKKAYSELPKTRLRPDGTPAKPLPAWDGGMKAPRSTEPAIVAFPCTHFT